MAIYQFIAPLVAIYYIIILIRELKYRKRFVFSFIMWLIFWLIITFLALAPDAISTKIATILGFKSNVTAVIFVVIAFLLILCFYLSSRIIKLEKQVTDLVRKIALDEQTLLELKQEKD